MVEVVERGPAQRSAAGAWSSSARIRWRSSAAAFSENVMAAMASIGTPSSTSVRMRADEGGGLAGAGAGLDEQRRRGVGADALAGRRGRAGRRPVRGRSGVEQEGELLSHRRRLLVVGGNHAASDGSGRLRSQFAHAGAVPRPSGSQNQQST